MKEVTVRPTGGDDTAMIQAALDSFGEEGGRLVLDGCGFIVTATIRIPWPVTFLMGEGT